MIKKREKEMRVRGFAPLVFEYNTIHVNLSQLIERG